jgi:adhesin transport system membrane fusion protein
MSDQSYPLLSALSAAQTPQLVSRLARIFAWMFVLLPLMMLFLPWQQNVTGIGKVVAYAPLERQQTIDAAVSGRITHWYVKEGQTVKKGDILVEISDFDPLLPARLEQQKANLTAKVVAKEQELNAYQNQQNNLTSALQVKMTMAQYKASMAEQKLRSETEALEAAKSTLATADFQFKRLKNLLQDGLVSQRDYEVAERDQQIARRKYNSVKADLEAARLNLQSVTADLERTRMDAEAKINAVQAYSNKTLSELEESRASLVKLQVSLSRQQTQSIRAPRDGSILRLLVNPQAQVVKQGEPLAILIPKTDQYAVELWVDGNDAPLILAHNHVRLQFEGWPAVQFVGWPEVAVGTFGGQVAFIDSTDDGKGKFRVMVIPDPNDMAWPSDRFLRQGVNVRGWVLLSQVSLGYEIWRQLNGFPPILTPESPLYNVARKHFK